MTGRPLGHPISIGSNGTLGAELCDANDTSIQIVALENVLVASNTTISNAEIAAGNDVDMGSNNQVNLTGKGATIQALNDVWVASTGTFGACPNAGEGPPGPLTGPIIGLNNRLVD